MRKYYQVSLQSKDSRHMPLPVSLESELVFQNLQHFRKYINESVYSVICYLITDPHLLLLP